MIHLQEIWNFWADFLKTDKLCIAGGSVRDFYLGNTPKDYDIFLFQRLYNGQLESLKDKTIVDIPWHYSEPFLQGQFLIDGKIHQLMVREEFDVDSLLATFDWNVSLFAYKNLVFTKKVDLSEIGEGKYLRLQHTENPVSTLRRGYRFSERFKMKLDFTTIHKLATMIAAIPLVSDPKTPTPLVSPDTSGS